MATEMPGWLAGQLLKALPTGPARCSLHTAAGETQMWVRGPLDGDEWTCIGTAADRIELDFSPHGAPVSVFTAAEDPADAPERLEEDEADEGRALSAERIAVIEKVADLWCGDWSGREFDGRDGAWWLMTALRGSDEELAEVRERLRQIEEDD
jgi:hypothetical protein